MKKSVKETTSKTFPQGFYYRGDHPQGKEYPLNFYATENKQFTPVDYPQNFYTNNQDKTSMLNRD